MQLKDQAAIVTGGASGLGAATARALASKGAKVAVCDLNAKLAETVAAEIKGVAVVADVSDAASAEAAVAQAAKAHGPARILVNCAGIGVAKRVIGRDFENRVGGGVRVSVWDYLPAIATDEAGHSACAFEADDGQPAVGCLQRDVQHGAVGDTRQVPS